MDRLQKKSEYIPLTPITSEFIENNNHIFDPIQGSIDNHSSKGSCQSFERCLIHAIYHGVMDFDIKKILKQKRNF
jgi:hypothetical protein